MDLLIVAGQVLVGPPGQRVPDGAVLVQDDVIKDVGPAAEVEARAPDTVRIVRFPDATVLPGLFNCHVHLAFDAGPDPVATVQAADASELLLRMAARAGQLLRCGVTTVRDLGDRDGLALKLRDAIAEGALPGPRILSAAAPLTVPGGHCWYFGGEVADEQAIREMVGRNATMGADLIKVMVSGGQTTPGGAAMWESQFDVEQLRVIVREAHRHGLPVAAHAHGTDSISVSAAAGVDTIEHCTWLTEGRFDPRTEIAEQIANKEIAVCPTSSPNWRSLERFVGPERAAQLHGRLRWLDDHGVRLVIGSDAGLPGSVFDDAVSALELYQHLGFSHERIIEMATVHAADALGLAGITGRLANGLSADLLVVNGDPLVDLTALRDVRFVCAKGRPHIPTDVALATTNPADV
jgi:imidazolonepropionase-like amidohydrolase